MPDGRWLLPVLPKFPPKAVPPEAQSPPRSQAASCHPTLARSKWLRKSLNSSVWATHRFSSPSPDLVGRRL